MDSDKKDARKMPRNEVFLAFFVAFFVPLLEKSERIDHPWGFNPAPAPPLHQASVAETSSNSMALGCQPSARTNGFPRSSWLRRGSKASKKTIYDKFHGVDRTKILSDSPFHVET
jgi:hypothetical protein